MRDIISKPRGGLTTQQGVIFIHGIQELPSFPDPLYIISANMRHHTPFTIETQPILDTSLATLQITQPHVKQQILLLMDALTQFALVQAEISVKNLVVLLHHPNYMPHSAGELVAVHHFMAHKPLTIASNTTRITSKTPP